MSEVNHTYPHMPSHFIIRSPQTRTVVSWTFSVLPLFHPQKSPHHSVRLKAHRQVQVRPATAPQGMASSSQVIHTSQHCCPHKQLLCLSGCHLTKGEGGTSIPCVELEEASFGERRFPTQSHPKPPQQLAYSQHTDSLAIC